MGAMGWEEVEFWEEMGNDRKRTAMATDLAAGGGGAMFQVTADRENTENSWELGRREKN